MFRFRSANRHLDIMTFLFRVVVAGIAFLGVGAAIGYLVGNNTSGVFAYVATYCALAGMATVFLAGTALFVLTVVKFWRILRGR
jgi:hypothetical protein